MEVKKIISISGKSGLFEMLTSTKSGIIATSLLDKKRVMVPFTSVSALDEIAIYTYNEEIALWEVFKNMAEKEDYKKSINHKASKQELEKYFREVLPEFDEDKVYASHIKKITQWYNILQQTDQLKSFIEARAKLEEEFKQEEAKKKLEK